MKNITKPRLVFFRWTQEEIPQFVRLHLQQHVKCLSEFFEVIVISENCDYQQVCDKYQPDLTLFESGVYTGKREIQNTSAYPEIPKLGFCNADAYCESRDVFISDMARWGIETFFCLSVAMGEYTPEIADNLFVWPNFVDSDLYRDYGESKIIPVLFTGSLATHYPWRNRISKIVSQYYPSLMCPHFGWYGNEITSRMIYGEKYARVLNASLVIPTCGTIANEVVRKHFEIPASKSCLITEKTPSLEAAGFVDMENCIFTDESDVLDKLDYLFKNPEELERITNAGYQLVHSRHTLKQRDQIFQWFRLYKDLKPHQKIVQTSPFEQLIIVDKSSGLKNSHIISNGLDRVLLRQGDEKLRAGKYEEAEALYLRCLNYQAYIPEPKLRLALCNLYKGNAETALDWILQPIKSNLEGYKAIDPDPVEWTYFIISLLCQGKLDQAIESANQFPSLCHPELERIRLVIDVLKNRDANTLPCSEYFKYRSSVHQLPSRSFNEWIDNLCVMLMACKQPHTAENIKSLLTNQSRKLNQSINITSEQERKKHGTSIGKLIQNVEPIHVLFQRWLKTKLRKFLLNPLNKLEKIFGYFLPYRFSEIKNDDFYKTINNLITKESINTALIIGASAKEGITEAVLTGIQQNSNRPITFCINIPNPQFIKLQKRYVKKSFARFYTIQSSLHQPFSDLGNLIQKIQEENHIDCFDMILIDSSELTVSIELEGLYRASFFVLDDTNSFQNYKNYHRLITDPNYILVTHNPSARNGYAIFQQIPN